MSMMAGQTINDRLLAAKHSLAGQGLAKSVCKATTEELLGPKKKHLDCKLRKILSYLQLVAFSDSNPINNGLDYRMLTRSTPFFT
jgi:hypothetical protein